MPRRFEVPRLHLALVLLLIAGNAPSRTSARVVFVAADAAGANDGSSWTDAQTDLQSALTQALAGDEIWVKAGTYRPTAGSDRDASFTLRSGVSLYGGFNGTESSRDQRDWTLHQTILSGDIGAPGPDVFAAYPDRAGLRTTPEDRVAEFRAWSAAVFRRFGKSTLGQPWDNSRHVVTGSGTDSSAVLDGFTIRDGGDLAGTGSGGGVLIVAGSPRIAHTLITENIHRAGAGLDTDESSAPQLIDVTFQNNSTSGYVAGGMHNRGGRPRLENVRFVNNFSAISGGGMLSWGAAELTDCLFLDNTADDQAGGMQCQGSARLKRVRFVNNASGGPGGGLYLLGDSLYGNPTLQDVEFDGNQGASRCCNGGGGLRIEMGEPTVTNAVFRRNAGVFGGALSVSGNAVLTNVTITDNHAAIGGGIFVTTRWDGSGGAPQFANLVLHGNTASSMGPELHIEAGAPMFAHSLVAGCGGSGLGWNLAYGHDGGGNLDEDPRFVDPQHVELQLQLSSPAVNRGSNAAVPPGVSLDVVGNPRIVGPAVDMGAYEVQMQLPQFSTQAIPPGNGVGPSRGAAWSDYDGDGDDDLFVTRTGAPCLLLRNDGLGAFADAQAGSLGLAGGWAGAAWGDFTDDGRLDLYVARLDGSNALYWNGGSLGFFDATPAALQVGGGSHSVTWVDFDNDGDLDLYVTVSGGQPSRLYQNSEAGTFVEVTASPLNDIGAIESAAWGDYDNDGDQDLYLVKFDGANRLFRNEGSGQFMDVTAGPLGDPGQGAAAAWGDFDNDRDLDLYVCNADGPNHLLRNDGALGFVEATPLGLDDVGPGTGVSWLDYDNDGWLDLYFANAPGSNHLFRNIGSGFLDMTVAPLDAPGSESATCVADFDNDGDVDLFLASHEAGSPNLLLRNDLVGANRWLQVDLHGTASNRFGVGARLRVVAAGTSQIRAIAAGYGRYAQDSFTAHFGLGVAAAVDTLEIQWPSGIRQTVTELAVDQRVTVLEDANSTAARPRATSRQFALHAASPNPFNPTTTLKFGLPATLHVRLHIYDVAGRLVRTLVDEARPAGEHLTVWDGRGDNGAATASGVYHARLEAGAAVRTMRLVLVR